MPFATCPHCKKEVDLPVGGGNYACPHCRGKIFTASHVYKMVQLPPDITIQEGVPDDDLAAEHLERVVNKYARQGWEFYRVDQVGIRIRPGCLSSLFGGRMRTIIYHVITFRRPVAPGD